MSLTSHLVSVNTHGLRPFVDCPPTSSFVKDWTSTDTCDPCNTVHDTARQPLEDMPDAGHDCNQDAGHIGMACNWFTLLLARSRSLSASLSLSLPLSLSPALSLSHSLCSCLSPSRPLDILHACLPVFLLSFPSCLPSYFLLASLYTSLACKVRPYVFPLLCLMGSSCVCETVIVYLLFCGRVCD